jgi:hypothetical protein
VSHNDNATLAATGVMAFLGVPWLLLVMPIVARVLVAGDWNASQVLVEQGLHWGGFFIGGLICLILMVGAVLE